jgi:cell wall-associated NlpC family hydrolase
VTAPGGGVEPDATAFVAVAVASLWASPDLARPVDEQSLTNPVDVRRWVSTMTVPDKLWLVDKLVTQALYGDRVTVLETSGAWSRVAVPSQPSSQDPRGYPGWLPSAQLARSQSPGTGSLALVARRTSMLRDPADPARALLELSYDTRLPVLAEGPTWITVATPGGGRGLLAASDVEVAPPGRRPPAGPDLVRTAQSFSGLAYLWAGTSAFGFDCSGFTSTVYRAHGVVIPRDADDQAAAGSPVDRSRLQAGDLLFYASDQGRGRVHHVAMYVGDGLMIQSPATGKTVETVAVDSPPYAREFSGARRYLPSPTATGAR